MLPAIQREFVWRPEQVCRLFDSLMQGFPFGIPGPVNTGKSATMPRKWLVQTYPDLDQRRGVCDDHLLGRVPKKMTGFPKFYDVRRKRLVGRIRKLLVNNGSD